MDPSIFTKSAFELAMMIKRREISSSELVQAHIHRLEKVNPYINAVIEPLYDEALKLAAKADQMTRQKEIKELPPLHGVPCSIKGNLAYKGKRWTAGSWYRKDCIADFTATAVDRYLKGGMIPLCLTNVSEVTLWMETNNIVHGRTNNPHHLSRTVGGSSGGEAAVIAAGGTPVGLGSDIGGSIRIPSFFCGIAGHKPSPGLIPQTGHWPVPEGLVGRYSCTGPMGRRVSDLYALLKILQGPDGTDPQARDLPLADPRGVDLKKTRVFFYTEDGHIPTEPVIKETVLKAASHLEEMGCRVEEWSPSLFKKGLLIWFAMVGAANSGRFVEILGDGKPIPLIKECLLYPLGRSRHTLPALGLALIEAVGGRQKKWIEHYLKEGEALKRELREKLGEDGIMLGPVYSHVAPRHHVPKMRPFNWVYSAIYNVLEMPATAIPTGKTKEGFPLGVQIAANQGCDHLSLAVGSVLEKPVSPVEVSPHSRFFHSSRIKAS